MDCHMYRLSQVVYSGSDIVCVGKESKMTGQICWTQSQSFCISGDVPKITTG